MHTRLISITPDAEQTMLYIARVSSPNQNSGDTKLLKYCIEHQHWSVFEHAFMTVEINTSRTIGRQILRHKSFAFSEFSQRYATTTTFEKYTPRLPAEKNRQSSVKPASKLQRIIYKVLESGLQAISNKAYQIALAIGVSKECARFLLLETASTRMYMTGSIRSWIHYLSLRAQADTQLEHQQISRAIIELFVAEMPTLGITVFGDMK